LSANTEEKWCIYQQIKDYAMQGFEFEKMRFFTFTVKIYECHLPSLFKDRDVNNQEINEQGQPMISPLQYLSNHPKHATHFQVTQVEFHDFLSNIIGPWFPCQDGDNDTKAYYYTSMLTY
jgi:hypothetical protein